MNELSSALTRIIETIANLTLSRVAIVALIITAAYYFTMYDDGSALHTRIKTAKTQLATENKKKNETQQVLKKEQQMKADVELLATKFEELRSKIPVEFLESELRDTVNQLATKNSLKTTRTERRPQAQKPFSLEAIAAGENLVQQVVLYYEFEGSYANITKFANEISHLEKVVKIGDLNIVIPRGATAAKGRANDLTFRASVVGYKQTPLEVLKEQEERVRPKAGRARAKK